MVLALGNWHFPRGCVEFRNRPTFQVARLNTCAFRSSTVIGRASGQGKARDLIRTIINK